MQEQFIIIGIYLPLSCIHACGLFYCFFPSSRRFRRDAWSVETSSTSYRTLKYTIMHIYVYNIQALMCDKKMDELAYFYSLHG